MKRFLRFLTITFTAILVGLVFAGDIPIAWNHDGHPDLAGFRVFYEEGTVGESSPSLVTGPEARTFAVPNLTDCTEWHIGVQAFNPDGVLSGWAENADGSNNIIRGWPTVKITGAYYTRDGVTRVTGINFGPTAPRVWVDDVLATASAHTCEEIQFAGYPGARVVVHVDQVNGDIIGAVFTVPLQKPYDVLRGDIVVETVE